MPTKGLVRTKTTIGNCPLKNNKKQQKTIESKSIDKSILPSVDNYYTCTICGLQINSVESLEVHMQYQHEEMNRWGVPTQSVQPSANNNSNATINTIHASATTTTSSPSSAPTSKIAVTSSSTLPPTTIGDTINNNGGGGNNTGAILSNSTPSRSPTDSENNNQPSNKHLNQAAYGHHHQVKSNSPQQTNNTVSAAADSSDNQPPTPQPSIGNGPNSSISQITPVDPHNQINPHIYSSTNTQYLPQEMHPYPAYMHSYDQFYHPPPGMDYSQSSLYASNQMSAAVTPHQEYKLVPSSRYHPYLNNNSNIGNSNNSSNSNNHLQQQSLSQQNANPPNSNGNNTNTSSSISNSSLSPRIVSSSSPTQNTILGQTAQDTVTISHITQGQPTPSPSPKQCDKCGMVCQTNAQLSEHYSAAHGVQTSSDSITRTTGEESDLQSQYSYQPYVKEEPGSDILDLDSQKMVYPPQHDPSSQEQVLPPMHSMHPMHRPIMWGAEMHPNYMPHAQTDLKQPYYSPIKQPYPPIKQEYGMKQEYQSGGGFGTQMIKSEFNQTMNQTNRTDLNKFQTDTSSSNPVSSSPSEFPSTTTPQDNGPQFRGFEPPTSSLPSNAGVAKSTTWKSNEARRPKTYNCTACNKWFTSSGHLKRHYNTTLHKNAVKSSGQPDPATMPISAHHHPSRDPNSKHNRTMQPRQPPPAPPEPPRSPEYTPQYTPPPGGFSQQPQSFQQYSSSLHSTANGHPNAQAGPSVHASQQRGLLIISTMEAASNNLEQEEQVQHNQQPVQEREDQYHQLILEPGSHLNLTSHNLEVQQSPQQVHIISMSPHHQRQDIISTIPTTTTPNTMDQQRYIISPLAINTTTHTTNTIPSFQHLQHPVEHLQNYHTIIGNESHLVNNPSDNLLQMTSFDTHSSPSQSQNIQLGTTITAIPVHQLHTTTNGQHFTSLAAIGNSVVEVHRISTGGVASCQENSGQPFSPVVPESLIRCVPLKCESSPQEADVAPPQSVATQPPPSFPYSPTISSTVTSSSLSLSSSVVGTQQEIKKPVAKRKRSGTIKSVKVEDKSLTTTNLSTAPLTPPKIECVECGKEFAKACYLTQHNKTFHSGEQPFRCQKCGKRFQCQQTYDTHLDKHKAQDKPFKCDKCPKQFHHKTDLRRHRDGHTGYKAHVCDTCSKGFCRKDHLRKHSDTHKPKPNKIANNNAATKLIKKETVEVQ